jgi:threonine synthase
MRERIEGIVVTDQETRDTMRRVYQDTGVMIDPHTAVGVLASHRFLESSGYPGLILSLATAHPGKFVDVVEQATGSAPELPAALREAMEKQKQAIPLEPSLDLLRGFLLDRYL